MEKPSHPLAAGFAAACGLALFGWLAGAVAHGKTMAIDMAIRDAVHAWASPGLTAAMRVVTRLGAAELLVPLGLLLAWGLAAAGRWPAARLFLVAAIGGEVLDQALKTAYQRVRPLAFFGYPQPLGYGFPSGHAMMSFCFYGVAAAILTAGMRSRSGRALIWGCVGLLAAALGFSRVYLGVHYPSDVLAGYLAAAIWVAAVRVVCLVAWRRGAPTRGSSE